MKVGLILNNKTKPEPINGMDLYRLCFAYFGVQSEDIEVHLLSEDEFDLSEELIYDVYVINRSRELFRAQRVNGRS